MTQAEIRGHLAALFTIIVWGTTFISTKVLLVGLSPVEILFLRFFLSLIALFAVCPRSLKWQGGEKELMMALAGLTGVCLYYLMENIALEHTLASNVSVIISTSPFFTVLVGMAITKGAKKPSALFFVGFVLAMAGIVLLNLDDGGFDADILGNLLALGASFMWALYSHITKRIASYGFDTIQTTRRSFMYGLVFMLPFLIFMDFSPDVDFLFQPAVLANIAFLAFCASALCFVTWNRAVGVLGAVTTSFYIYLNPVVTVVCSVIILSEPMNLMRATGCILTLAGLVISNLKQH